jgi:hypothetical protein
MRLERTGSKTPAGGVNEEVNQMSSASWRQPKRRGVRAGSARSLVHPSAYRESYILGMGQLEFRPEHVAQTPGYEFRVHFPNQNERVF